MIAATLATHYSEKAPELFVYQATIIRAEWNYEAGRWMAYDRQFRREALAQNGQFPTPSCTMRHLRAGPDHSTLWILSPEQPC